MVPLEREFGWSAALISSAIALNIAIFGLCGPFAAAAMQRFGLRPVVAASLGINGVAFGLTAFVRDPLQLIVLWGVCVGIGTGLTSNVLAATVATRWFVKGRGVVVGLLTAGVSTGQLVFLPLLASIEGAHGWRTVVFLVGACALAIAVPCVLLLRDRPADLGLAPYGGTAIELAPAVKANPIAIAFSELAAVAGRRDFQLLFATFFVCGASTSGLIATHFIAACGDHSIPQATAATFLAAMGLFDLLGTTFSGYLTDRYDARALLFIYYSLRGLSLLALPLVLAAGGPLMWAFTIFYGLDWIATIPPTLKLTNASFGTASGPLVYGWIVAGHQLGGSAAALLGGLVRTGFGAYDLSFWISGGLCLAAAFMALAIGRRATPIGSRIGDGVTV
jgi:predicted MFS family arabinose efflux permease